MVDVGDLPDEAVEAAAKALYAAHGRLATWTELAPDQRMYWADLASVSVATAAPVLERVLRDRIANEIEREGREAVSFFAGDDTKEGRCRLIGAEDAYKDAIHIVRGGVSGDRETERTDG